MTGTATTVRVALLALCTVLMGCASGKDRVTFDGQYFRGSTKAVERSDRAVFVASVRGVERSIEGAREALAYEGTKYCIRWYGTSKIDWAVAPDDEALVPVNDTLTTEGRCQE